VKGGWRKLHSKEFNNFYSSVNIIWIIKSRTLYGQSCSMQEGDEKCAQNVGGKASSLDCSADVGIDWGGNIKFDIKKIGWKGVRWIYVSQDIKYTSE
jgi:hypothetical protein